MNVWVVTTHDPIPVVDNSIRPLRYGLLSNSLVNMGHSVVLWTSEFAHWNKQNRKINKRTIDIAPGFTVEFLKASRVQRLIRDCQILLLLKFHVSNLPNRHHNSQRQTIYHL